MAMGLAKELTALSLAEIGARFSAVKITAPSCTPVARFRNYAKPIFKSKKIIRTFYAFYQASA